MIRHHCTNAFKRGDGELDVRDQGESRSPGGPERAIGNSDPSLVATIQLSGDNDPTAVSEAQTFETAAIQLSGNNDPTAVSETQTSIARRQSQNTSRTREGRPVKVYGRGSRFQDFRRCKERRRESGERTQLLVASP